MDRWRTVKWSVVAVVALPLVCGTALLAAGNDRGDQLVAVALGLLAGLPLTWRKDGGPPSIPPGVPAVVVALASALALSGCGGSSPPPSACAVARVLRDPCRVVESTATECEAVPDGAAPQR